MISFKILIAGSFLALYLPPTLKAQAFFKLEVTCNELCGSDSNLFFQEIKPENIFLDTIGENTNLYGPYFKQFPQIHLDLLSALSYYPELANAHIQFSYKSIHQTMNSRPSPGNLFRKKANRHYSIIVNNNKGKQKGLPFDELSVTIKTGWIGHELAHICEYKTMNNWQTFWFAVKYISSKKYIRKVERITDLITIEHGLAYPLYEGTEYLLQNKEISEKYRKYALTNGLSLSEIKCLWCKYRDGKTVLSENESAKRKQD